MTNGKGTDPAASASASSSGQSTGASTGAETTSDHAQSQGRAHSSAERSGASGTASEEIVAPPADPQYWSFGVHKSLRYHAKRRAFFDSWHRWSVAISAISGSATFAAIFGDAPPLFPKITSGVVAVMAGLDVGFGFSERARRHDDLYRRFADLAAEMARTPAPSDKDRGRWNAKRLLIERDEPTALRMLDIHCHNEEATARDLGSEHIYPPWWWQRTAMHFLSLPPYRLVSEARLANEEPDGK